jgi:hypothetical protein
VDISTRKKNDTSITHCQLNAIANTDDALAHSKSTKLFEMSKNQLIYIPFIDSHQVVDLTFFRI